MTTAAAAIVAEELEPLRNIAESKGWALNVRTPTAFSLGLPAKDGTTAHFMVDCDGYASQPPAWHYLNPGTGALDQPPDSPQGGGYFHASGVICAPWNRLAYTSVNPAGPHGDWQIGDWRANPQTGGTKTLAAMALRVAHELLANYTGRRG